MLSARVKSWLALRREQFFEYRPLGNRISESIVGLRRIRLESVQKLAGRGLMPRKAHFSHIIRFDVNSSKAEGINSTEFMKIPIHKLPIISAVEANKHWFLVFLGYRCYPLKELLH